ncbi:MAG: TlpA family protein disulfide reductase [Verrucomicrobiota bacterium]|jgi:hypothetical protein|nr:TlpA family protein disulfide reductase [Verrucomicrobiota bacterium]
MMRNSWLVLVSACVMAAVCAVSAQDAASFDAAHKAVLSKLQSMGHGYYSEKEWAEVDQSVEALVADAVARRDGTAIVRAAVIKAMVLGDMRRQYAASVQVLENAVQQVSAMEGVDASPLYVKQAEVWAEAGKPAEVEAVMAEYKASRYYDPKPYAWSGGSQPGDPLLVARPNAPGGNSVPLTVMQQALVRAKSAPGTLFPDANLTDLSGRSFALSSLRGKVVLVDFFARGWKTWEENLPQVRELWDRYHTQGFAVLSICLEPAASGLESLHLPWPVVANAPALTRELGIFGASTSYLLDSNGMVVARDLRGSDLAFAVQRALGQH